MSDLTYTKTTVAPDVAQITFSDGMTITDTSGGTVDPFELRRQAYNSETLTPHENAVLFWQMTANLRCSPDPKRRALAPVAELQAFAWDRIAKRQRQAENEEKGDGNDAA